MIMRDTVLVLVDRLDEDGRAAVTAAVGQRVGAVSEYVPGYSLKQEVQFLDEDDTVATLAPEASGPLTRVSVFLEVKGAAHYLPEYAGNLDIMTSAALRVAERLVSTREEA
jgi:acetaldehyde dehydrogenase